MDFEIRPGKPGDIPAALQLVRELAQYEKAPHEVQVTEQEMINWGFGDDKIFGFFVATVKSEIVGMALYYYKYSTWKGKCLFLEDIIVTESARRRGIGQALFSRIVLLAKEQKVRRLEWQVLEWNQPAIDFYKKNNALLDNEWINGKLTCEQINQLAGD